MDWDWTYAEEILPQLIHGLKITLFATAIGSVVAMTLGLLLAIGLRSQRKIVRVSLSAAGDFIRSTPLLIQLYLLFYVFPDIGITLDPLVAGIAGIGIHYACYTAQVYRAGIESVNKGQTEAALALNLTNVQRWIYIIIPQAVPPMIPALANYVIGMFKETALLSAITVVELMTQAQHIANNSYRYLEPFTVAGFLYLIVNIPATALVHSLESKYSKQRIA